MMPSTQKSKARIEYFTDRLQSTFTEDNFSCWTTPEPTKGKDRAQIVMAKVSQGYRQLTLIFYQNI